MIQEATDPPTWVADEAHRSSGLPDVVLQALEHAHAQGASDVHLRRDKQVWIRRGSEFRVWTESPVIQLDALNMAKQHVGKDGTVQTIVADGCRWRTLVFDSGMVLRRVNEQPPDLSMLSLPDVVGTFTRFSNGLIVFAGPTGSGKSSSIAALLMMMTTSRRLHVLTVEVPIEFIIPEGKSLVTQQHVPADEHKQALENALRADPDVVMLGECRLPSHFELCLTLAATGHLVMTTIHAGNARSVCERIVAATGKVGQSMLSNTLRAVVSQHLVSAADSDVGRWAACEVMEVNPAIRNCIADGALEQLQTRIADSHLSLEHSLVGLVKAARITRMAAKLVANDEAALGRLLAV